MLELWPQQRPALRENMLAMHGLLHKNYQPYAERLPALCRPSQDWLNYDLLPALILLPNAGQAAAEPVNLAFALELSFLAGRVHDLTALARTGPEPAALPETSLAATSRAILIGDYLYALAAIRLAGSGYNKWLGRIGRLLCRRSEGKLERLSWAKRSYVPEGERLANLHKENAEGLALAAELAVARLAWPQAAKQAWTEFGFYIGQAQGVLLYEPKLAATALVDPLGQAEQALSDWPGLQAAAGDIIVNRLRTEAGLNQAALAKEAKKNII